MATTTFNDLITFSRGSNATVTGPNGLIQWAPANLLPNSQDFEAAAWTKQNATITANAVVAPDGTSTADTLVETTAAAVEHRLFQGPTTTGGAFTFSAYVRAAGRTWAYLRINDSTGNGRHVWFNLAAGTVGTVQTNLTASIAAAENGWYCCTATISSTNVGVNACVIGAAPADNVSQYTGDGISGISIWGAQLELGSTATTYNNTSVRNLLGFSEAFDNAAWTKTNSSIVTGAQANPINGLFNAQKLMEGTANIQYAIFRSVTVSAATHTFSLYAKLAPGTARFLSLYPQGTGNAWAIFDLALGTITAVSALNYVSSAIVPVGSGWYRCSITVNATAGSLFCNAYLTNSSGTPAPSYLGDGNSGVYIYGAMLSNSASLDPYVPTPGAAPSSTAYYGPRFDYDPVTLLPRGLLVEEARTNSLTYSEQFDNAAWTKVNATVTANSAVAPDGASTADLVTVTGASGRVLQNCTYTAAAQTFSVYLKASTTADTLLRIVDVTPTTFTLTISWSGGVPSFVSNTGSSYAIQSVGNGWYRVSMTATTAAGAGTAQVFANGFGSSGATLIWGAQLEAGAFATSYIPTIASTVTRSADVATITGSLFSQWYNQPEGSLFAEITSNGISSSSYLYPIAMNESGTVTNVMGFASNSGVISVRIRSGGTESMDVGSGVSMTGGIRKMATAARVNDFAFVVNAGTVLTDATGAMPVSLNRLEIPGSNFGSSHVRSIRYVPVRAADFQLQQVTT